MRPEKPPIIPFGLSGGIFLYDFDQSLAGERLEAVPVPVFVQSRRAESVSGFENTRVRAYPDSLSRARFNLKL